MYSLLKILLALVLALTILMHWKKPELRLPVPMVAVRTRRKLLNLKTRLMTSLLTTNRTREELGYLMTIRP